MKGVVFSTTFFILIFVVFINLSNYIYFDHNRSLINNAFKKAMKLTAVQVYDENDMNNVLNILNTEISQNLPEDFKYTFELIGYNEKPLLIRVRLVATSNKSKYTYTMEETIIEKEGDDSAS